MTGPSHNKTVVCFEKYKEFQDIEVLDRIDTFEKYNGINLCTHIIVDTYITDDDSMPWSAAEHWINMPDFIQKWLKKREKYPHLNWIILGIHSTAELFEMATYPKTRRKFIRQALDYILRNKFDGLDLFWDSTSYNETDKKSLVSLVKEFRTVFDYSNLLLTSTFGSYDGDIQFNTEDPHLFEMSEFLDLMHISNQSTITDFIKMNVPSTKLTIQQSLNLFPRPAASYKESYPYFYLCSSLMREYNEYEVIKYNAEKYEVVIRNVHDKLLLYVFHFEKSRHIANNMRWAMKHNLAGALVFSPSNDDDEGCLVERDTFMDFRTMEGINLDIPVRNGSLQRIQVVNDAIIVSLDEMAQVAQLFKQNDQCKVKV